MGGLKLAAIGVLLFLIIVVDFRMFLMSLLADAVLVAGIAAIYHFWPDKE
jgi:hypothetical protein